MRDLDLLRFIVDPSDRAYEYWEAWAGSGDIEDHSPDAFAMFPAAYRKLEQLGLEHPWRPRLRGVRRREWAHQQMRTAAVDEACTILEAAGVDHLLPIERSISLASDHLVVWRGDNRIVVRWHEIRAAMSTLVEAGWEVHRSPLRSDPRRRLNVIDDGVRSPRGDWIALSDHHITPNAGRRGNERTWNAASSIDGSRSFVAAAADLARAVASDPTGGVESVDCALRLHALTAGPDQRLVITTEATSWRDADRFVDARIAWFESIGGRPIERVPVTDIAIGPRSTKERLSTWRDVVVRWGGVTGSIRSFVR